MMPDDLIKKIRDLYAATTPGKWIAEAIGSEGYVVRVEGQSAMHWQHYGLWVARVFDGKWKWLKANAEFIAEVHNIVPVLTQRITTLEEENARLRERLEKEGVKN